MAFAPRQTCTGSAQGPRLQYTALYGYTENPIDAYRAVQDGINSRHQYVYVSARRWVAAIDRSQTTTTACTRRGDSRTVSSCRARIYSERTDPPLTICALLPCMWCWRPACGRPSLRRPGFRSSRRRNNAPTGNIEHYDRRLRIGWIVGDEGVRTIKGIVISAGVAAP
jgi:hypothetical protein